VLLEGTRECLVEERAECRTGIPIERRRVRQLDVDHDVMLPHRAGPEHAWATTLPATPVRVRECGTCLRL
jgi:hypothetical protein